MSVRKRIINLKFKFVQEYRIVNHDRSTGKEHLILISRRDDTMDISNFCGLGKPGTGKFRCKINNRKPAYLTKEEMMTLLVKFFNQDAWLIIDIIKDLRP